MGEGKDVGGHIRQRAKRRALREALLRTKQERAKERKRAVEVSLWCVL